VGRMLTLGETDEVERLLREATEARPSPGAWFELADHYVDREDYPGALAAFERALELTRDPHPMLVFAYADTLIQAGDIPAARRVAERLEAEAMRDLIEGRSLLAQGDAQGALQALESGVELWPNNATARLLAGRAAEQIADFERAIVHYRGSMRGGAGSTQAGALLAELYAAQGNLRLALDIAQRYLRVRQRDPDAHLLAIRMAHRSGRHQLCSQGFTRLAELPGQAPLAVAEQTRLLAADRGAAAAVEVMARSPLDLTRPGNAEALRALLEPLAALGQHEEAQARVAAALEAQPKAAVFHELQARVLRAAGAPSQQVREAFERAAELDPEHAPALLGLAELAAERSEPQGVLALYDRAAQAAPDEPAAAYAAIQLVLADGRSEEAERRLVELLQRHPRHAGATLDLARLLLRRGGEPERALALARRATLFGPGPASFEVLGWVQLERGEPRLAVAALNRALEFEPDAVAARYRLGLALEALGDEPGAAQAYRVALEAGPGLPEVEQRAAQARLARLQARGAAATR